MMQRYHSDLEELSKKEHDVVVIGGGIIGSFIYRDCALRGIKPILIERHDFGGGATSGSTKLAHGGIRYLARMKDWKLVKESLKEREILKKIAPYLVYESDFLLPIYDNSIEFPKFIEKIVSSKFLPTALNQAFQLKAIELGIKLYEKFGLKNKEYEFLGKDYLKDLLPKKNLIDILKYSDGRIRHPERLSLEAIIDGDNYGGESFNYLEVSGIIPKKGSNPNSVILNHKEKSYSIDCKVIINSSGPDINQFSPQGKNLVLKVGGIHAVIPKFKGSEALKGSSLVLPIRNKKNKKILFIIPEKDSFLIGTTETKLDGRMESYEYKPTREEIDELFSLVKNTIPSFDVSPIDVIYSYAGVRPLVYQDSSNVSSISRKDLIEEEKNYNIIHVSGKITPARAVAERVTDRIIEILGLEKIPCKTSKTPLCMRTQLKKSFHEIFKENNLPAPVLANLIETYGSNYTGVLSLIEKNPDLFRIINEKYLLAQVDYAIRFEKAKKLSDVMLRRTDMGKTKTLGFDVVYEIADFMEERLNWTEEEKLKQMLLYKKEVKHRYSSG